MKGILPAQQGVPKRIAAAQPGRERKSDGGGAAPARSNGRPINGSRLLEEAVSAAARWPARSNQCQGTNGFLSGLIDGAGNVSVNRKGTIRGGRRVPPRPSRRTGRLRPLGFQGLSELFSRGERPASFDEEM